MIVDRNGDELPGAFFGGTPSIVRDGFMWRVWVDGTVAAVANGDDLSTEYGYPFFSDAACNVPLTETPVVDNAAFEELGISNLAVQYKSEYFAPGNVLTADFYWKPGLGGTCQLFDQEVRGLGAQLQKPADFIGPISVVAL